MYCRYRSAVGNPFEEFLAVADRAMNIGIRATRLPAIAVAQRTEFTQNVEQRNFCADLFARIERVAFSFDRLCELTVDHHTFEDAIDASRDAGGKHTYSEQEMRAMARWHTETDVLRFYIYYELKSVIDMLEQWRISLVNGSELEYVLKARDRFLAHPEFHRVTPHAYRGKEIPYKTGFTRCYIAGLQQWDSVTREEYLSKLGLVGHVEFRQQTKEAEDNEAMIRSTTRNEKLTAEQISRLKAFGVREPELEKALREFATELLPKTLKRFEEIHEEALCRFGFERGPGGPLMSSKMRP
jgi:hypothetical protein